MDLIDPAPLADALTELAESCRRMSESVTRVLAALARIDALIGGMALPAVADPKAPWAV